MRDECFCVVCLLAIVVLYSVVVYLFHEMTTATGRIADFQVKKCLFYIGFGMCILDDWLKGRIKEAMNQTGRSIVGTAGFTLVPFHLL